MLICVRARMCVCRFFSRASKSFIVTPNLTVQDKMLPLAALFSFLPHLLLDSRLLSWIRVFNGKQKRNNWRRYLRSVLSWLQFLIFTSCFLSCHFWLSGCRDTSFMWETSQAWLRRTDHPHSSTSRFFMWCSLRWHWNNNAFSSVTVTL